MSAPKTPEPPTTPDQPEPPAHDPRDSERDPPGEMEFPGAEPPETDDWLSS